MPTVHIRGSQVFLTECVWRKSCCQSVNMSEKRMDAVLKPEVRFHRAVSTDVQLVVVTKEEDPPEQQEWRPSLDQEDPPELPHIKEEQEELWTSQEGEQLRGLEEDEIIKFTFNPVSVKSEEEDEEELQSSQLHQRQTEEMKAEADREDCGGPEPARTFSSYSHLHPDTDDKTSHSSEPETEDSCDWEETKEPESGLNPTRNNEGAVSDEEFNPGETSLCSSECASSFGNKEHLQEHGAIQTVVKSFSCSVSGKRHPEDSLTTHMRLHSEGKFFSCSVCEKTFQRRGEVVMHMRIHTGEKPFSCSVCGARFAQSSNLTSHLRVHTGEKPFTCSVCQANFSDRGALSTHMRIHTGEKPFSCSVCSKGFGDRGNLRRHMTVHTGEKPFRCSVCGQRFTLQGTLRRHLAVHTGEKPFSCGVCGKRFALQGTLRRHLAVHTGERPFSCSVCHKRFTRHHFLKIHKCAGESSEDK